MTRRRLLLIASLPLAIAMIVGVLAMLPPRPGVTKANFDRIEIGMSKAEVEEILGPAADIPLPSSSLDPNDWHLWMADDWSQGHIGFVNDRVNVIGNWLESDETMLDKVRRLLHLN